LKIADCDLARTAIFLGIKGDLLALDEAADIGALKSRGVNENVLAAVLRLDEAKAFLAVVELYCSENHGIALSMAGAWGKSVRDRRSSGSVEFWRESERAPDSARQTARWFGQSIDDTYMGLNGGNCKAHFVTLERELTLRQALRQLAEAEGCGIRILIGHR
jgi:hypothetical protein